MARMNASAYKSASKHKARKGTFKRLIKDIFAYNPAYMVTIITCLFISAIAGLASSVFIKKITDDIVYTGIDLSFKGQSLDPVWNQLMIIIICMVVIYLAGMISSFIWNRMMAILTQRYLNKTRQEMFKHMETLPIKYFDTHAHGDIMSLYTNDVDTLRQLISQSIPSLLSTIISVIALLGIMLTYSLWLTLVVIFMTILMLLTTKSIGGKSSKFFVQQQVSIGKVEGYIEESIAGQKVIKVFTHEQKSIEEFKVKNDKLFEDANAANKFGNILMPIIGNLGNFLYVLIAIVGSLLFAFNAINVTIINISPLTIGIVISFLTMARQFTNNIAQFSQQASSIVMGLAGADRIYLLLDEKSEEDHGYVTLVNAKYDENGNIIESIENTRLYAWKHPHQDGSITYTELKGDIILDDVDFGYVPEKLVLHDVDIYAHPGEKIAFVGATGAGKTTITNLINRFYDIADGKIRYDGININKIKKPDLRRSLGIVLQDTNLFSGTVKDNIRFGKLDATDEEVFEAAKIANAYDFITRLPDGFDTVLTGDGANLSQGQRQLLSIARAAIKDAPVMILDEATSSIDTRTELLVQKGTDKLMEGRTVFVIAHRLSTVKNSNAIMVLDHGHIIERGNHDSLIAKKGTYYQLYTGAFELE